MKKIFVILLVIFAILAAYAVWTVRDSGPTDAAELLPGDTVAVASIPDLPRTASQMAEDDAGQDRLRAGDEGLSASGPSNI